MLQLIWIQSSQRSHWTAWSFSLTFFGQILQGKLGWLILHMMLVSWFCEWNLVGNWLVHIVKQDLVLFMQWPWLKFFRMSNMLCKSYGKITLISISYYIVIILGALAILNENNTKKRWTTYGQIEIHNIG